MKEEENKDKETSNYAKFALFMAVFLFALALIALLSGRGGDDGKNYDSFATCIAESGAKMYGASWCSHCKDQKEAFGDSWKILENTVYVECDPYGNGQAELCIQEGIRGYPTWKFANGNEMGGFLTFPVIAEQTGCAIE